MIKVAGLRPTTLLKETLAQVFSCEFCKISKSTFSYRTPPVAAFENKIIRRYLSLKILVTEEADDKKRLLMFENENT